MVNFPTLSTSHFVNSHIVNIDQMGIDEAGIDKVGIDEVGRYRERVGSGDETIGTVGTGGCSDNY